MTQAPFKLLTVTWAGDRTHFSLLRSSLDHSAFATIPHEVVVQSEDIHLFSEFAMHPSVRLIPSADVLPGDAESKRLNARSQQKRWGRRGVKWGGSLCRRFGWPDWVRYTGWHTQQLSKLAQVAASDVDTVAVLDSDLIVTRHASASDFLADSQFVCYEQWKPLPEITGKVRNWQSSAHRLFEKAMPESGALDCYYDTPFVMHAPTVRAMMAHLEKRYDKPWWQVLLSLPPRQWSEFGCYKRYVRDFVDSGRVQWRPTHMIECLYNPSDIERLLHRFDELAEQQACHFITIHSESNRHSRGAEPYRDEVKRRIERQPRLSPET